MTMALIKSRDRKERERETLAKTDRIIDKNRETFLENKVIAIPDHLFI